MPKYTYSLATEIKSMVEWRLEHYHEDMKSIAEYRAGNMPSITQGYPLSVGGRKGAAYDPTAGAAIKMVTSQYLLETERSISAISRALEYCDEIDMRLVSLVYWKRSHSAVGAGQVVGLEKSGTYQRINKILCRIAFELGYVNI